jgi:hypothetical protein
MRVRVLLLCLTLGGVSCSPTEPDPGVEVTTNKTEYLVNEGFNLRVVNYSHESAWLQTSSCGDRLRYRYDIEERVGWRWELWLPVNECPALGLAQPRALHPAREVWETGFWTIPPGRYRIRISLGTTSDDIGRTEIHSNEFVVVADSAGVRQR